jgi:hypothetical protein
LRRAILVLMMELPVSNTITLMVTSWVFTFVYTGCLRLNTEPLYIQRAGRATEFYCEKELPILHHAIDLSNSDSAGLV